MRLGWTIFMLPLCGCALAIKDVRVQVEPDLKASVSALASQNSDPPGTDRAFLDNWRRTIAECGGATRASVGGSRPEIEARFVIANDRDRRIITNCLATTNVDFHYDLSVSRGWIYDTYSLHVRVVDAFLGPALIPNHFEVQMPGTIIDHTDNSRWLTHTIAWTTDGGVATAEIQILSQDALRRVVEQARRLPESAREDILNRVWEFEVRSQERKVSIVEMIGFVSMIAGIVPLAGVLSRPFRRRRKARASAQPPPETESGNA